MAKETNDGDKTKQSIAKVFELVQAGQAPKEVVGFFQNLSPDEVKFWLHGFYVALSKKRTVKNSEFYQFLKNQLV